VSLVNRLEKHRDVLQLFAVWFGLFSVYMIAFSLSQIAPWPDRIRWSFAYSLPPVLLGWVVAVWLLPYLPNHTLWRILIILIASVACSLLMYLATTLMLGLGQVRSPSSSADSFLQRSEFVWQIMQGMAYFVVALLMGILCELISAQSNLIAAEDGQEISRVDHILLRTDGGIITLPVDDIVHITAADDYCDIATGTSRHLARISLAECEERLSTKPFLRIHRSHMIHLSHMLSAESAGNGRLQVLMKNGDKLVSSRTGAQALRARAV
jgi:hypothetical protein